MKLPLVVLVGPTGVGKTAISVEVAKRIGGEIISGDSMQVYRGMDIGTGKITPVEMQGVPHYLINIKDPDEFFSVAEFQSRVDQLVNEIASRGKIPMLVGGTGLYVRSVLQVYTFADRGEDQALREGLASQEREHGSGYLHGQLQAVDPAAAARLHPNDQRRLIRALEVYLLTGVPISQTQRAQEDERRYDDLFVGLTMEREALYERIDQRVDLMLADGWMEEVRSLLKRYGPHLSPMEAIGYRELVFHLRGLLTWPETAPLIKRNTRRYAKRQFTWFRRDERLQWLDLTTPADRANAVEKIVNMAEGNWPKGVERL